MFQTKVIWVEGGHKRGTTDLTLSGVVKVKSRSHRFF